MFENEQVLTAATAIEAETTPAPQPRLAVLKSQLHKEFGDTIFKSWIAPLEFVGFQAGVLTLSVPSRLIRDWVKSHYADRIRSLWLKDFGSINRVDIIIAAAKAPVATVEAFEKPVIANENAAPAAKAEAPALPVSPLDPRCTFENFVTGKPNELAYAAARKIAESEEVAFNPLFLTGGVGLGKTHLMHAIAHEIRARNPKRRVIYMSAEKFMYEFVMAIRFKDTLSFKQQFRSVDVLMIDDIQFICGKESTQEEFFHTFNALIDQGKQIVISADKSPSNLDGIEERLRSRLGMGLVAEIHPTTYELRLGILQARCALLNRPLPQDVLAFLAQRIAANVRELEGALHRLIAHAELVNRPVTLETAEELLQDLLRANDRRLSIEDIQKRVAEHYNIRLADMHSPRRARPVARPRQVAMYLAKQLTSHSLPEIGRKFGGRDHTTIIHGVRKIEELLQTDTALLHDVESLKRSLAG